MVSEKMFTALNDQLNREMFSSYTYLAMAAHFEAESWDGIAKWFKAQADEEHEHAMKFYSYINERNGRVTLNQIDRPQEKWDTPQAAFEDAFKKEQEITSHINNLMDLAIEEKDHATRIFLQWFITEQVEEENLFQTILDKFKMLGGAPQGMFYIDRDLGNRQG